MYSLAAEIVIFIIFPWKNTHKIAEELHSVFICMLDLI